MAWIQSNHHFDRRCAILYVTHKHMMMERLLFRELSENKEPEALEAAVRELIARYRPELADGSVLAMGYDQREFVWQFTVEHPSLKRVPFGSEAPRLPLDPAYERELEV